MERWLAADRKDIVKDFKFVECLNLIDLYFIYKVINIEKFSTRGLKFCIGVKLLIVHRGPIHISLQESQMFLQAPAVVTPINSVKSKLWALPYVAQPPATFFLLLTS